MSSLDIASTGSDAKKTGDRGARTESTKLFMKILTIIKSALLRRNFLLPQTEQSMRACFDTPYTFLINDAPLPLDFAGRQFRASGYGLSALP